MASIPTQLGRPADVPDDWMLTADEIYQAEANLDPPTGQSRAAIAAEALAHLTAVTAFAQRLLTGRQEWAELAVTYGATLDEVAAAMGVHDSSEGPVWLSREINWPSWGEGLVECKTCRVDFRPDSSPDPYLCWSCDEADSERLAGGPR